MGKGKSCDIEGCQNLAERSLPLERVEKAGMLAKEDEGRRVYLCKGHYKELKKKLKNDRKVEKWKRSF
ncbi:MAG: hypothetical protein QW220_07260 [Candidatus Bathyarchaeia archaeon]